MMDPLAPLLNLTDVESAVKSAREAVDGAYRHRALRRKGGPLAVEISLRSAVASATLSSGLVHELEEVRAGAVLDPMMQGSLRVAEALPGLVDLWPKAPGQVLAKLHLLAGTGVVAGLGAPAVPVDRVCAYISGGFGDPLIRAAVVHGELLVLNPFPVVNGVIARAAARLTLISSGLDPRGLVCTDLVHLERQPEYLGAAGAFATGTADGIRNWLRHCALAVELGSATIGEVGDTLL